MNDKINSSKSLGSVVVGDRVRVDDQTSYVAAVTYEGSETRTLTLVDRPMPGRVAGRTFQMDVALLEALRHLGVRVRVIEAEQVSLRPEMIAEPRVRTRRATRRDDVRAAGRLAA